MSEELIKRLRFMGDPANGSVDHRTIREAAEALSRPAPAVTVPVGWALVPVEPTPEMLAATSWPGCAATDYEHMLAAAPAPAPVATEAVAQGGGVDAEKVMGLVEEYGAEMKDLGQHTAEGYALGIMQDEKETARLHAQIRALLTPATCKEVLQVAGWIPVGEMLPDMEAGYVLVHCEGGKIGDDFFCRNREFLHHSGNRYSRKHQGKESGYFQSSHMYGYRITHWQPLPPPPAIANQEARDGR